MTDGFWGVFFDSWGGLVRVAVVGILAYVALVICLRVSGKRTLSKMNAFDLVVTVALGSTLATVILSQDVALVEGVAAFALLISLQYVISWLSMRSSRVGSLVKSEPTLVFYQGTYLHGQMRSMRLVEPEVLAAIRGQGIASLDDVQAVVLESDGSLTVVRRADGPEDALVRTSGRRAIGKRELRRRVDSRCRRRFRAAMMGGDRLEQDPPAGLPALLTRVAVPLLGSGEAVTEGERALEPRSSILLHASGELLTKDE